MKAYQIGAQQGLDSLVMTDVPTPEPGAGQVVVKMRAVCLNHRDLLILSGKYGPVRPETRIPVSDGVGEIAALGEGVSGFAEGERVVMPHFVNWVGGPFNPAVFGHDVGVSLDGWLAEYLLVPAHALVKIPDAMSDAQAAPLAAAALTAWNSLHVVGGMKSGDAVLSLGTGGVSILALQLAKMAGARFCITSSSDEKLERARDLGADVTINYRSNPDWEKEAFDRLGGGADIILETGGLATLQKSIAAAAPNGRIAIIGALAGSVADPLPAFGTIIGKNLGLHGIAAGSRAMLVDLVKAVSANGMTPVINRSFGFSEAAAAYAYLASGDHFGKVMIEMD